MVVLLLVNVKVSRFENPLEFIEKSQFDKWADTAIASLSSSYSPSYPHSQKKIEYHQCIPLSSPWSWISSRLNSSRIILTFFTDNKQVVLSGWTHSNSFEVTFMVSLLCEWRSNYKVPVTARISFQLQHKWFENKVFNLVNNLASFQPCNSILFYISCYIYFHSNIIILADRHLQGPILSTRIYLVYRFSVSIYLKSDLRIYKAWFSVHKLWAWWRGRWGGGG